MTKILEEVKAISSDAIAKKQDAAKNKMPEILKQIKGAATLGKLECEFMECQIDEHSKKLLEYDGFRVYATRRLKSNSYNYRQFLTQEEKEITVWIVAW